MAASHRGGAVSVTPTRLGCVHHRLFREGSGAPKNEVAPKYDEFSVFDLLSGCDGVPTCEQVMVEVGYLRALRVMLDLSTFLLSEHQFGNKSWLKLGI